MKAIRGRLNIVNLEHSDTLAYILGILDGDGSVYFNEQKFTYKVILGVKDEDFAVSFATALNEIGLRSSQCIDSKGTFYVQAYSKMLCTYYLQREWEKWIPTYPIGYVRGFYESEGCCAWRSRHHKQWGYFFQMACADKKRISLCQDCLKRLRIKSIFNSHQDSRPNRKLIHILTIGRRDEIVKFANLIQPCIKNKPRTSQGNTEPSRKCSVENCEQPSYCKGFCVKHYARYRRHGNPLTVKHFSGRTCPKCRRYIRKDGFCGRCNEWTGGSGSI